MTDRGAIGGLIALLALLLWLLVAGAGWAAGAFWQTSSLLFVIGGAVVAGMLAVPHGGPGKLVAVLRKAFRDRVGKPEGLVITLVALAEVARRDGLLALDKPVEGIKDGFLKQGLQMVIDGADPQLIESVMQTELEATDLRHLEGKALLESIGRFAPAFGMIGTLVGLVVMLGRLENPGQIGPGMAVALLTTFYGLVIANLVCWPLARRLAHRSSQELLAKTMALRGVLSIQAGDHPRVVATRLRAYLPPSQRGEDYQWKPMSRLKAEPAAPADVRMPERPAVASAAAKVAARSAGATKPAGPATGESKVKIDEATARKLARGLGKLAKNKRPQVVDAA